MRVLTGLWCAAALLVSVTPAAQSRSEPFIPIGVWYSGEARGNLPARDAARDAWRRDLGTIHALGFNSITTPVDWAPAEPERRRYALDTIDELLTIAEDVGLKVIVQLQTDSAPGWVRRRYPDASVAASESLTGSHGGEDYCSDHPGIRGDLVSFIGAVAERAARHASFYGIDVWRDPRVGIWPVNTPAKSCCCRYTQIRFREWLKTKYGSLAALNAAWNRTLTSWDQLEPPGYTRRGSSTDVVDWDTFLRIKLREDLKLRADASAPRGPRPVTGHSGEPAIMLDPLSGIPDDWWMSGVVDHYGTSMYPKRAAAAVPWSPVRVAATLDAIRSAGRDKGWSLGELQGGPALGRGASAVTGNDLRLWGWAAISRGARAISYRSWHVAGSNDVSGGYAMIEPDGRVTERARAAGDFAAVVSRNVRLFAPLRPRPSRVAILYDRSANVLGKAARTPRDALPGSTMEFYRAMFERNIQTDFIHPDEVVAGQALGYATILAGSPLTPSPLVAETLKGYVHAGGTLVNEDANTMRGRSKLLERLAVTTGMSPEVRIDGGAGTVEARFLESSDALVLIAINYADAPRKVTMTFTPETPEAIWQDMESGAAVNFVAGPSGPTYVHAFGARDVVVLAIKKGLR